MVTSYELSHIASKYFPEPHASLFNGILLGISLKHTGPFYKETIDAGLAHLVVVSGSNFSFIVEGILKSFFFVPKQVAILIAFITIVLFMLLVGMQPPVMRAVFTHSLILLGSLTGREAPALYTLLITAIINLVLWPEWVSSISFYLTYLSTTGIILFAKPLFYGDEAVSTVTKLIRYILNEFKTSVAAQVFIAPVLLIFFGRLSFISIITSVITAWALPPITFLGFLLILLSKLGVNNIPFISQPLYWLLNYVVIVIHTFS